MQDDEGEKEDDGASVANRGLETPAQDRLGRAEPIKRAKRYLDNISRLLIQVASGKLSRAANTLWYGPKASASLFMSRHGIWSLATRRMGCHCP